MTQRRELARGAERDLNGDGGQGGRAQIDLQQQSKATGHWGGIILGPVTRSSRAEGPRARPEKSLWQERGTGRRQGPPQQAAAPTKRGDGVHTLQAARPEGRRRRSGEDLGFQGRDLSLSHSLNASRKVRSGHMGFTVRRWDRHRRAAAHKGCAAGRYFAAGTWTKGARPQKPGWRESASLLRAAAARTGVPSASIKLTLAAAERDKACCTQQVCDGHKLEDEAPAVAGVQERTRRVDRGAADER